jgi:hypothetical protein
MNETIISVLNFIRCCKKVLEWAPNFISFIDFLIICYLRCLNELVITGPIIQRVFYGWVHKIRDKGVNRENNFEEKTLREIDRFYKARGEVF